MAYVRASGYRMKDPDDDAFAQVIVGDLERFALDLKRGSVNSAYVLNSDAAKNLGISGGQSPSQQVNVTSITNGGTGSNSALGSLFNLGGMPIGGTLLATSYSGSGTHTFTVGKRFFFFRLTGGGGQGGGTPGAANMYGGGGGEGATLFGCARISGFTTAAYTVGAGGTGGTANSNGGDGTASTLVINGVTLTAGAGLGGSVGGTAFVADNYGYGGAGGAVQYWVDTQFFQWGTSGVMGQPGGYSRRGLAGQTYLSGSGVAPGAGSTSGAQGNAAAAGTAGTVTFYEI